MAIPERPAQTTATASNVLAYPEADAPADDATPMVLMPPLLHNEKTFIEDINEGVCRETSADKTPLDALHVLRDQSTVSSVKCSRNNAKRTGHNNPLSYSQCLVQGA